MISTGCMKHGDNTHAPKQAFSADVANVSMSIEMLVQKRFKKLPQALDVGNEILLANDSLHF